MEMHHPTLDDARALDESLRQVIRIERAFTLDCLPYPAMTNVPPAFAAYARWHHGAVLRGRPRWSDACPAYALAFLTFAAYGSRLDDSIEWELELQWDDLRGMSALDWPHARSLIVDAWAFLADVCAAEPAGTNLPASRATPGG